MDSKKDSPGLTGRSLILDIHPSPPSPFLNTLLPFVPVSPTSCCPPAFFSLHLYFIFFLMFSPLYGYSYWLLKFSSPGNGPTSHKRWVIPGILLNAIIRLYLFKCLSHLCTDCQTIDAKTWLCSIAAVIVPIIVPLFGVQLSYNRTPVSYRYNLLRGHVLDGVYSHYF